MLQNVVIQPVIDSIAGNVIETPTDDPQWKVDEPDCERSQYKQPAANSPSFRSSSFIVFGLLAHGNNPRFAFSVATF